MMRIARQLLRGVAFALLAIDQYWRAQEKATPRFEARVWVGDTPLIRQTFEGRSTRAVVEHVAMAKLTQAGGMDVVFERAGKAGDARLPGLLAACAPLKYPH